MVARKPWRGLDDDAFRDHLTWEVVVPDRSCPFPHQLEQRNGAGKKFIEERGTKRCRDSSVAGGS